MSAHIYIPCDSAAISVGADQVADALAEAVGENAHITRNSSRGLFWLEPLIEIDTPEGRIGYGPVTTDDLPGLIDAGLLEGKPGHPLCLGLVEDIPFLKNQERLTFARAGITAPLDLAGYRAHGGLAGLEKAKTLGSPATIAEIETSGLRGRGGAGFPAHIKWSTVAKTDAGTKYVVCNADEGDSGTFADRMVMEGDPFLLLEGMTIAGLTVGAELGLIYVRSEYPTAITRLKAAIEVARHDGWLGDGFDIEVRTGAGAYICGEESSMLESLEGRRGQVRVKPPIPAIKGYLGQPTLVHNVLSLAAIPTILAKGGAFYRDFGMGRSRGTQPFQLGGNIKQGGLVEKAFGLTIGELVNGFGGGTLSGRPVRAVQLGGPLGAYVSPEQFDLPMDYETLAANQAMLGHGGLVVFDDSVDMAEMARFAFDFCAIESCGKCTPCRVGAVRGRETMDKIIAGTDVDANLKLVEDLCETMTDGSLCAMGGLTPMPVRSAIRLFPEHFRTAKVAE